MVRPELVDSGAQPALVWRAGAGWRMAAIAVHGGGIGRRSWVLNLQVPIEYARLDPEAHVAEVAAMLGLGGPGVGLLTAARVDAARWAESGGAEVCGTVGLAAPTLAAAAPAESEWSPGTINLIAAVPARLSDAALLNAIATITEAKAQALADAGFDCTGTATDTVTVAAAETGEVENFGGPRSRWGSRLARAAYAVVRSAAVEDWARHRSVRVVPEWLADVDLRWVSKSSSGLGTASGTMDAAEGRLDREGA